MTTTAKTLRSTEDVAAGVARMIRSLGRRIEMEDPEALIQLIDLQSELSSCLTSAVYAQREQGHTDGDIASVLGVTRQAVTKRWPGDGRFRGAAGRYRNPTPTQED
jgi:hypothetical protein